MGCATSVEKLSVESSLQETQDNPLQGIPVLRQALEQRAFAGQEVSAKKNVAHVFALLPKTLGGLNWTMAPKIAHRNAVMDAGAVIERCVKLANDPALGESSPAIDTINLKRCINHFSSFLKQMKDQGGESYKLHFTEDEASSRGAMAVADAIRALFQLEDHAAACRQEVVNSLLKVAVSCVKADSGLTPAAKTALLTMLIALLEEPKGTLPYVQQQRISSTAQVLIDSHVIDALLPYFREPSMFEASKEFMSLCRGLLESCIKNGQDVPNKASLEVSIRKANN